MRVLYGLERLPTTLSHDDPRLPAVELGARPLRLNSVPLPAASWPEASDHAARMAALRDWLASGCGEYDRVSRQFMQRYLDSVAAHVARHAAELEALLAPFDGLYNIQDWCWSALRPLPRAWLPEGRADIAFWDGVQAIPVKPKALPSGDLIEDILPPAFRRFWQNQTLPTSPFRRMLPAMTDQTVISSV